jgi:hypothetical protein
MTLLARVDAAPPDRFVVSCDRFVGDVSLAVTVLARFTAAMVSARISGTCLSALFALFALFA